MIILTLFIAIIAQANRISEAFTGSRNSDELFIFLVIILIAIAGFVIYRVVKYLLKQPIAARKKMLKDLVGSHFEINLIQKKQIFLIIDDFRKRDRIASEVPASVLEKFAEHFIKNIDRLKISSKDAEMLRKKNYPLVKGTLIEVEIQNGTQLFVYETKVIYIDTRSITLDFFSSPDYIPEKGVQVHICYAINNAFISGDAKINGVYPDKQIVISHPKSFNLTNERRYSRIPVEKVYGSIELDESEEPADFALVDISMEGIRIKTQWKLKKSKIYRLSFNDHIAGVEYNIANVECVIYKTFIAKKGYREYGMGFFYPKYDVRHNINQYIKALSLNYIGNTK